MYTVTDLVPNALLGISRATAISKSGVVVGTDFGAGFIWIPNQQNGTVGSSQSLPTDISPGVRPVATATPQAVNAAGMVVGVCRTIDAYGTDVDRAFSFVQGGILVDLGTFVPDSANPGHFLGYSDAKGVNDAGQIVGWADDANGVRRAFLFDPAVGQMQDVSAAHALSLPAGTLDPSEATAINNAGVIVGSATFIDAANNAVQQAFVRQSSQTTLDGLGTLLPDPLQAGLFFGSSSALALNSTGVVVGQSDAIPPVTPLGVIFSTPNIPLGPLPNQALGANSGTSLDQVVGHFWPNPGDPKMSGFVADVTNGMVDLNTQLATPGWRIESATGINDFGQICGVGTHNTLGGPRAILLTP
ncbi:hypothetical protein [Peribacillus butanolivorans]|uniref:hypothetical protein n=1 Tax=Peribacillus butanolivorans TaxID=421767 RepID=UPI0036DCD2C2